MPQVRINMLLKSTEQSSESEALRKARLAQTYLDVPNSYGKCFPCNLKGMYWACPQHSDLQYDNYSLQQYPMCST